MNRSLTRAAAAAALTLAAVLSVVTAPPSSADATGPNVPRSWVRPGVVEPPVIHVPAADRRIVYAQRVEGTRWLLTEFNDGRLVVLRPCRYEDGRRCWWDADTSGAAGGDSFAVFGGRVFYLADVPRSNV